MMPVDPAANSLLRFTTRTSGAPDAVATALPVGAAGLGANAGDIVVWPLSFERRFGVGALRNRATASRMKSAAGRRIQRARNRTRDRLHTMVTAGGDARD